MKSLFPQFEDLYLVTYLMGADLNNIIKTQKLSDDHIAFLVYQILRGSLIVDDSDRSIIEICFERKKQFISRFRKAL